MDKKRLMNAVLSGIGRDRKRKNRILYDLGSKEPFSSDSDDSDFDPSYEKSGGGNPGPSKPSTAGGKKRKISGRTRSMPGLMPEDYQDISSDSNTSDDVESDSPASKRAKLIKPSKKARKTVKTRSHAKAAGDSDSDFESESVSTSVSKRSAATNRPRRSCAMTRKRAKTFDDDVFNGCSGSGDDDVGGSSSKKSVQPSLNRFRNGDGRTSMGRLEDSENEEIFPQVTWSGPVRDLPSEIWTRIFQWTVDREGPLPFLLKMGTVCSVFRRAAGAPELWKWVDFNTGKIKQNKQLEVVEHVTKHFMRSNFTKHLNLGHLTKLKEEQFKEILEKTPNLESLNLSFCRNLNANSVLNQILGENFPKLKDLDLTSFVESSFGKTGVRGFLEQRSKGLEYLYLNKNRISDMSGILRNATSWACAPTLVSLDLSGITTGKDWELKSVCIRHFAKATPNLQYYRAIDFKVSFRLDNEEKEHGLWQHLKEVNVSLAELKSYVSNLHSRLLKFLRGCHSLRRLDLSNVPVNLNDVSFLDCSLTHLLMSKCISSRVENAALYRFMLALRQFGLGLIELDVSWCTDEELIKLICDVLSERAGVNDRGPRLLEKLHLKGCPVDQKKLREMLRACEKLSWLDISSCRSLPLGVKRVYTSRRDIEDLIKKL